MARSWMDKLWMRRGDLGEHCYGSVRQCVSNSEVPEPENSGHREGANGTFNTAVFAYCLFYILFFSQSHTHYSERQSFWYTGTCDRRCLLLCRGYSEEDRVESSLTGEGYFQLSHVSRRSGSAMQIRHYLGSSSVPCHGYHFRVCSLTVNLDEILISS